MKARYFDERLVGCGITPAIPDLNTPAFKEMTLTRQIERVGSLLEVSDDCVIIGSSMGGLVATLSATRFPSVKALILLAPGFGIEKRWGDLVDPAKRNTWKQEGAIEVYHYATERSEQLSYSFVEDLESYSTRNISVSIPTLILHGIHDDVVPVGESRNFIKQNPDHAKLVELDDGHQLVDTLPTIWTSSHDFLRHHSLL